MSPVPILLLALLAACSVYSYLIYPAILVLVPGRRGVAAQPRDPEAKLTIIIAAHNEAARIAQKIDNTLQLRSHFPQLEILVASDASDDGTDGIVHGYAADEVSLIRSPARNGKEYAQGLAIAAATGDIIVFTDTGTTIGASSIARVVELFDDRSVGAVSSEDRIVGDADEPIGEGLYVRYEMWLRQLESRRAGLVGLSGSFFAARREVLDDWDASIPSDFCVAINARRAGFRSVSDPGVIGEYKNVERPSDETARKIRTVLRGMAALADKSRMLNPFRHGLFAFQLFSHKLMRWAVPWFALAYLLVAVVLTVQNRAMAWSLAPVVAFAVLVAGALAVPALRSSPAVGPFYYLFVTNVAVFRAALQFFAGRRITTWAPSRR